MIRGAIFLAATMSAKNATKSPISIFNDSINYRQCVFNHVKLIPRSDTLLNCVPSHVFFSSAFCVPHSELIKTLRFFIGRILMKNAMSNENWAFLCKTGPGSTFLIAKAWLERPCSPLFLPLFVGYLFRGYLSVSNSLASNLFGRLKHVQWRRCFIAFVRFYLRVKCSFQLRLSLKVSSDLQLMQQLKLTTNGSGCPIRLQE